MHTVPDRLLSWWSLSKLHQCVESKCFRMESEKLISNYTPNPRSKENDLENDFNYGNNVISASAEVRKGFLRKVYGILTVQLLMTCGVSGIFGF